MRPISAPSKRDRRHARHGLDRRERFRKMCILFLWSIAGALLGGLPCRAGDRDRSGDPVRLPEADRPRRDVLAFVELHRVKDPGTPYGIYRAKPSEAPDLYPSCHAARIRYFLGDLKLGDREKRERIAPIDGYQDPVTGKYPSPRFLHRFVMAARALNALGGSPRHPARFLAEWDDLGSTEKWMASLPWNSPWEQTIQILHVAAPRGAALSPGSGSSRRREWLAGVLDWPDARQDRASGFWGPDRGSSLFDGMGAAFHFLPLYEAAGRTLRYGDALVDSTTDDCI